MKNLSKITILFFILFSMASYSDAQSFTVNNQQSSVKWNGKKVTGEHYGSINFNSGTLQAKDGQVSGGMFEMDMNSITVEDITDENTNARLKGHLKSDDFFSVNAHPVSRLNITSVKKLSGNEYEFTGNLTIKAITHPITFKATTSVNGSTLQAEGRMVVNRAQYDIKFRSGSFFQNLGDNLIYDEFTLDFKLVAQQQ